MVFGVVERAFKKKIPMFTYKKVNEILGAYGDALSVNKDNIFFNMKELKSFVYY